MLLELEAEDEEEVDEVDGTVADGVATGVGRNTSRRCPLGCDRLVSLGVVIGYRKFTGGLEVNRILGDGWLGSGDIGGDMLVVDGCAGEKSGDEEVADECGKSDKRGTFGYGETPPGVVGGDCAQA